MAAIRPILSTLVSGMAENFASKALPVMMPLMSEMMPAMINSRMPEVMVKNETAKEFMPEMMMAVIPHCVKNFSFMMDPAGQEQFFTQLTNSIGQFRKVDT